MSDIILPTVSSCTICFELLGDDFSKLETCNHSFCKKCIMRWAREKNVCPIDRTEFREITVITNQKFVSKIKVKPRKRRAVAQRYDISSVCEICQGERWKRRVLLICDGCSLGFHLKCLTPPLFHVPRGHWYCPSCSDILNARSRRNYERSVKKSKLAKEEQRFTKGDDSTANSLSIEKEESNSTAPRCSFCKRRIWKRKKTCRSCSKMFHLKCGRELLGQHGDWKCRMCASVHESSVPDEFELPKFGESSVAHKCAPIEGDDSTANTLSIEKEESNSAAPRCSFCKRRIWKRKKTCPSCSKMFHLKCGKQLLGQHGDWKCRMCASVHESSVPDKFELPKFGESSVVQKCIPIQVVESGAGTSTSVEANSLHVVPKCSTCKKKILKRKVECEICEQMFHMHCIGVFQVPRAVWWCRRCLNAQRSSVPDICQVSVPDVVDPLADISTTANNPEAVELPSHSTSTSLSGQMEIQCKYHTIPGWNIEICTLYLEKV